MNYFISQLMKQGYRVKKEGRSVVCFNRHAETLITIKQTAFGWTVRGFKNGETLIQLELSSISEVEDFLACV